MKHFFLLALMCFPILWKVSAQSPAIEVGEYQTTFLVFEHEIASVDRGVQSLLAEQDDVAKNILKLKAMDASMKETNLHVLTEDGTLHDFQVSYAHRPRKTTWDLRVISIHSQSKLTESAVFDFGLSRPDFLKIAKDLEAFPQPVLKKLFRYDMHLNLTGLYQKGDLLFFQFWIANSSAIPYKIADLQFRVKDRKSKKKSSHGEEELTPVFSQLEGKEIYLFESGKYFLVALPARAFADRKLLEFSLSESTGDRNLIMRLAGKRLLNAKELPSFHLNTISYGPGEL